MTIKRLATLTVVVLAIMAGGALGGLLAIFCCAGRLPFYQNPGNLPLPPAVEKHETVIQENKALKDAVAKVAGTAILIKIAAAGGAAAFGSGAILTSDGLAVTSSLLFPAGAKAEIIANGKKTSFEVLKRDKTLNLAVLKLESANWPTAGFYQLENLKLGERIFLVGVNPAGRNFVNEGIVRDFTDGIIATDIYEKNEILGAPAFDIEGNLLGIASLDKIGQVSIIPISKIKEASGL